MNEQFRRHIKEVTVPCIDEFGKMQFLEHVVSHEFYPYSDLGKFNSESIDDWKLYTRFLDTDTQYEDGAFNGVDKFTRAGGKAFYFTLA